ncbi:MAG TPA: GGDEF domain-containing protein [Chromatiales bacterium]|nr:GGDEF domain-containing protein [Thiotrichales bacterium]HIP67819.1 GGDEF domain-containing protein [Chromatiales bacterium]
MFASLLAGLLVCIALWEVQDHRLLQLWYLTLLISSAVRLTVFWRYRRAKPQGEALLKWEWPYAATLFASSSIWGLGALLIMPPDSMLHQVVLVFLLTGMSGGALAVYAPRRRMMLITIALMLVPVTLWLAFQGTSLSTVMTLGIIAFLITVIRSSKVASTHMHQSFVLALELKDARNRAERIAREDELTGMRNRRAFYEEGEKLSKCRRQKEGLLAMILIDIDHFKKINDTYGHANGDLVLKKVAEVLRETVRCSDICARIGGEEFGVLLRVFKAEDAKKLAQKLCQLIEKSTVPLTGDAASKAISATASFGVSTGNISLDTLFNAADTALYQAKAQGRNQVVCAA